MPNINAIKYFGFFLFLCAIILFFRIGRADQESKVPKISFELISGVESELVMPADSKGIKYYLRYYANEYEDGHILVGVFVANPNDSGIRIVSLEKMPKILDGGCRVIKLKYDIIRSKVISIFCNGIA